MLLLLPMMAMMMVMLMMTTTTTTRTTMIVMLMLMMVGLALAVGADVVLLGVRDAHRVQALLREEVLAHRTELAALDGDQRLEGLEDRVLEDRDG